MGPPRQSRHPPVEALSHTTVNGSTARHIHAKEKDILHKPLGNSGISKSKKTSGTLKPPTISHLSNNNDVLALATSDNGNSSKPPLNLGPGNSEQHMRWTTAPVSTLNRWRLHFQLPISAPFSSESARISLCHADGLGSRSASMRGPSGRQPTPRREMEAVIAKAWDGIVIDEEEVLAGFVARTEDRKGWERLGAAPEGGGGNIFGTGGRGVRHVRCRSDMLA